MANILHFQCRIVESILTNVAWFFECDDVDVPNFENPTGSGGSDGTGNPAADSVDMDAVMNNLTSGSGSSGSGCGSGGGIGIVAGQSSDALNEISNTMGSHSQLLLSNLQKLEESGKVRLS